MSTNKRWKSKCSVGSEHAIPLRCASWLLFLLLFIDFPFFLSRFLWKWDLLKSCVCCSWEGRTGKFFRCCLQWEEVGKDSTFLLYLLAMVLIWPEKLMEVPTSSRKWPWLFFNQKLSLWFPVAHNDPTSLQSCNLSASHQQYMQESSLWVLRINDQGEEVFSLHQINKSFSPPSLTQFWNFFFSLLCLKSSCLIKSGKAAPCEAVINIILIFFPGGMSSNEWTCVNLLGNRRLKVGLSWLEILDTYFSHLSLHSSEGKC